MAHSHLGALFVCSGAVRTATMVKLSNIFTNFNNEVRKAASDSSSSAIVGGGKTLLDVLTFNCGASAKTGINAKGVFSDLSNLKKEKVFKDLTRRAL